MRTYDLRTPLGVSAAMVLVLAVMGAPAAAQYDPHSPPPPPPDEGQPAEGGQAPQQVIIVPGDPIPAPESYGESDLHYREQMLRARLAYLQGERSQYGIGGPMSMLILGGVTAVIAGSSAWALWRLNSRFGRSGGLVEDRVRAGTVFTGLAIAGGVLTIVGSIRLAYRLRMRRQYKPEIVQIRRELRDIRIQQRQIQREQRYHYGAQLDLGFTPVGLGASLTF